MASAEGITVAVESAIHDGIADVLSRIEREFGIVVDEVRAEWIDVSTDGEPRHLLREVAIRSRTKMPVKRGA